MNSFSSKNMFSSIHRHQKTDDNIMKFSSNRKSLLSNKGTVKKVKENKKTQDDDDKRELLTLYNNKNDYEGMISMKKQLIESIPPKKHISSKGHNIFVCVRKRPLFTKEKQAGEIDCISATNPKVCVYDCKTKIDGITKYIDVNDFYFDNVFNETNNTMSLYESSIKPALDILTKGGIVTCFAYGQTGSGKTYTMKGIQELSIDYLFNTFIKGKTNFSIYLSFYEIYSGRLYDLLNNRNKVMALEDKNQKVQIYGLSEFEVKTAKDMKHIIVLANNMRTTHSTVTNETSSRSHAICNIVIKEKKKNEEYAKLLLVDLAGSERAAETQSNNKSRIAEGAEINKSLLALKECIRALDAKKHNKHNDTHIPFRTSKLTLVLRDSFVPKSNLSQIIMISCISPGNTSSNHTINTLRYADRLKEKTSTVKQYTRRNITTASTNLSMSLTLTNNHELSKCEPVPNDDDMISNCFDQEQEDKEKKTPLPIQLGRQSMRRSFLRKSIHTSKNSPQRMNKLFDDEVKYINNDKTEDQIKEDYEEEKEFIISSHMNVIKDEAKMLTKEGGLISRLKGVNNEQSLSMDEYANKIEKIVSKKLKYYMELKKKISNFKKMNI